MGFWDKPIIDKNSERSEDSVLKSLSFFSLKNGFNSHIVDGTKDYGVDIHCELIDENGATGNMFPIQIKSAEKAQYIYKNAVKYFTLKFLTSRLGYLCRQVPTYGIIVFYDESNEILYYDFVLEIYNRIRIEKKDETWKEKTHVTIHIPESNQVKFDLKSIHKTFINRFINTNALIEEYGDDFNIPSIGLRKPIKPVDSNSRRTIEAIKLLETIGPYLFNQRDYLKITGLLEILAKRDFHRPRISYIAAITYTEVGELLDADYFLKLSYARKEQYSGEEFFALEMQRFKVDFSLGLYDKGELLTKLKNLRENCENTDNLRNIDININMLEINQKIGKLSFDKNIISEVERIFEDIEQLTNNEEQKYFQKIFQSENLIGVLTRLYSDYLNDNRLLINENRFEPLKNRSNELKEIMSSFEKVVYIINDSLEYANTNNNKLMKAHALHKLAVAFFSMNLSHFINEKSPKDKHEAQTILESSIHNTISAYNLFIEIEVYQFAYHAITLAYEIYRLSEEWLGIYFERIGSIEQIKKEVENFRNYEFYNQFNSVIDKVVNDSVDKKQPKDLNDDELAILADRILKIKNLPNDRKVNLLNELKSFRHFEKKCKNEDLVLLSNQVYNGDSAYSVPSHYAIVSKNTGIIYAKGFNVDDMMCKLNLV